MQILVFFRPLCLPYISPISPLPLHRISHISPYISRADSRVLPPALPPAHRARSRLCGMGGRHLAPNPNPNPNPNPDPDPDPNPNPNQVAIVLEELEQMLSNW